MSLCCFKHAVSHFLLACVRCCDGARAFFQHAVGCWVSLVFAGQCGNVARSESGTGCTVRVFLLLSVLTMCSVHSSAHSARSDNSHAQSVLR